MFQYIYNNDFGEQKAFNTTEESDEAVEKMVVIYEGSDTYRDQKAVTQSEVHQQPGE